MASPVLDFAVDRPPVEALVVDRALERDAIQHGIDRRRRGYVTVTRQAQERRRLDAALAALHDALHAEEVDAEHADVVPTLCELRPWEPTAPAEQQAAWCAAVARHTEAAVARRAPVVIMLGQVLRVLGEPPAQESPARWLIAEFDRLSLRPAGDTRWAGLLDYTGRAAVDNVTAREGRHPYEQHLPLLAAPINRAIGANLRTALAQRCWGLDADVSPISWLLGAHELEQAADAVRERLPDLSSPVQVINSVHWTAIIDAGLRALVEEHADDVAAGADVADVAGGGGADGADITAFVDTDVRKMIGAMSWDGPSPGAAARARAHARAEAAMRASILYQLPDAIAWRVDERAECKPRSAFS